jgi:ABC-type multidrug transport system fused ATPase/permease subunit
VRYFVEALSVGLVLVFFSYVLRGHENIGIALSVVGIYVMAGNRLLPMVQQIFQGFSQIRYGIPALQAVLNDIRSVPPPELVLHDANLVQIESIAFSNLSYTYPGTTKKALHSLNIAFPANKIIGIVGLSGAGKTTLVDVLLGLLRPQEGSVVINQRNIDLTLSPHWRRLVGYVPQDTFLFDGTIAENIAFGVDSNCIDRARLTEVAISAGIHGLVQSLEKGFETQVGDRGVRFSGGQKQRIAIARALYPSPAVLIFDEATSALDVMTEREVIKAIISLPGQLTVFMISHRVLSLRAADLILHISGGEVEALGQFQELFEKSKEFRDLCQS